MKHKKELLLEMHFSRRQIGFFWPQFVCYCEIKTGLRTNSISNFVHCFES